jgi:hypothetical protein
VEGLRRTENGPRFYSYSAFAQEKNPDPAPGAFLTWTQVDADAAKIMSHMGLSFYHDNAGTGMAHCGCGKFGTCHTSAPHLSRDTSRARVTGSEEAN